MALYVRKKPIGININVDSHMPTKGLVEFDFTNFSPNVLNKWKMTKNMIAKTKGVPRPPFRMIEPSGAPIRNRTKQATDKVNFLCHSISCNLKEVILLA
jgi:hypothetical protein